MLQPNEGPREPYAKGQYIVWFVKGAEFDVDKIKEVLDNCGVTLDRMHAPERCVVKFDEAESNEVMNKLYGWPEYIRSVSRNHYLYLQ
ncbi:hypothetical protein [Nitrospira sp. BLG_2]|uniref:hypothetical protein n=1 Tax=Nitrospira sp. BLG_2 TaxID=3397507 RepID=UPI003B9D19DE